MNRSPADYWDELARHGPDASVIDPNDRRGHKNRYLAELRDGTILAALRGLPEGARVLDFGCGSGNLSKYLDGHGFNMTGVDISANMLRMTERLSLSNPHSFHLYDGENLPFADDEFDACVIYGVLIYLLEPEELQRTLDELHRVLRPGGRFVAIEQARRRRTIDSTQMKVQRTQSEYVAALEAAGFANPRATVVRRGHFPLLYAIRYGLMPSRLFPTIAGWERWWGSLFCSPCCDYVDVLLQCSKPPQPPAS